jgi:hypothetical protein
MKGTRSDRLVMAKEKIGRKKLDTHNLTNFMGVQDLIIQPISWVSAIEGIEGLSFLSL